MALAGRLLAAGIIVVGAAACTVAHRTDMFREDELTDAQQAIADAKLGAGDLTVEGSVDRPTRPTHPASRSHYR